MPVRGRCARAFACLVLAATVTASCQRAIGKDYEYEEQLYLDLDGSATLVINASIASLVALRGLALDPNPDTRFDRDEVRALFESPFARVTRVSRAWRRDGRRFVQLRLETDDVRTLGQVGPLSWARFGYRRDGGQAVYTQQVGAAANRVPPGIAWTGSELVAFRFHMPSKINFHNAPTHEVERGNILTFEQTLAERLEGAPIEVEVRMDATSIFLRTMTIFGLALAAAVALMMSVVWWVKRKGHAAQES